MEQKMFCPFLSIPIHRVEKNKTKQVYVCAKG